MERTFIAANLVTSGFLEASHGASIHRCQPGNVGECKLGGSKVKLPTKHVDPLAALWPANRPGLGLFTNLWWMDPGGEGRSATQKSERLATTRARPRPDQGTHGSRSRASGLQQGRLVASLKHVLSTPRNASTANEIKPFSGCPHLLVLLLRGCLGCRRLRGKPERLALEPDQGNPSDLHWNPGIKTNTEDT